VNAKLIIREGSRSDAAQIHGLIKELADYEKAPQEVDVSIEDIEKDGFGDNQRFKTILACEEQEVIGMALYYERYSTWKGPTLYLEDLVVKEAHRGKGAGKMLMDEILLIAKEGGYKRLEWQVLDWNSPAISFYENMGAELDGTWHNCRMTF
jgi:GNAT superfamily N-acetyltransferase